MSRTMSAEMSISMFAEIENLGLLVVNEEIENALDLYPDDSYREAFANPELRQKLVSYVMSGLQGIYPTLTTRQSQPVKTKFPYRSLELRLQIESYVHWGIEYLLDGKSGWVGYPLAREAQPSFTLCYWIG